MHMQSAVKITVMYVIFSVFYFHRLSIHGSMSFIAYKTIKLLTNHNETKILSYYFFLIILNKSSSNILVKKGF